jgi:hypothetical protein
MLSRDEFASGLLMSTAGTESSNFHKNIALTPKDVVVWRVEDFEESLVDWSLTLTKSSTRTRPRALRWGLQRGSVRPA